MVLQAYRIFQFQYYIANSLSIFDHTVFKPNQNLFLGKKNINKNRKFLNKNKEGVSRRVLM